MDLLVTHTNLQRQSGCELLGKRPQESLGNLLHGVELELLELLSQSIRNRYHAGLPEQLVVLPAYGSAVIDICHQLLSLQDDIVEKHLRIPVS